MNIDLNEYIELKIGNTSWAGESNHDNTSADNMSTLEGYLSQLENMYINCIYKLTDHKDYREGNASATHLHRKAKQILDKHKYFYEELKDIFEDLDNWDPQDE